MTGSNYLSPMAVAILALSNTVQLKKKKGGVTPQTKKIHPLWNIVNTHSVSLVI